MSNKYYIRYNTKSVDLKDKWRLINNDKETLVQDIYLDGVKLTCGIWNKKEGTTKYHVSVEGNVEMFGDVAFLTSSKKEAKETNALKRHILKTISYRIVGTLTTFSVSYIFTGSIVLASTLGVTELLIKPILYFLHERAWYKFVKIKK